MNKFSKKEALSFGWQTFKNNWMFLAGLTVFLLVINFLPSYLTGNSNKELGTYLFVLGLIFWFISLATTLGALRIYLLLVDHQPVKFSYLFSCGNLILKYLAASILSGLIIVLGFVLFIIPGLIFSLRLQFWPWIMVDQDLGPMASLKESWRITHGATLNLLLFNFLLGLVSLLVITMPVTQLATVFVYRKLQETNTLS